MIAEFQPQTRRSAAFAALVAAVALVTLTDARASEPMQLRVMPFSPAIRASMARLDVPVTLSANAGTIESILNTVSNQTGVAFEVAEDALTESARATRITINAQNAPAHAVVIESLAAAGLTLRFTENGALVEKAGDDIRVIHEAMPAAGPNIRVEVLRAPTQAPANEKVDVIIAAPERGDTPAGDVLAHRIDVEKSQIAEDGVIRTRLTFRGGQEGQPAGILELEVQNAASSAAH